MAGCAVLNIVPWPYQCELIKTTNGGTNWISQPKDSFPNWDLRSIDFINENIGWIIQGTYGGSGNSMRMRIHKTTDGGLTWDLKLLVYGDITPIALNKLKFINQDYGIVVGGGWRPERRIYKTTDSGETWDEQVFPTRGEFWDLSFMDQNYLYYSW